MTTYTLFFLFFFSKVKVSNQVAGMLGTEPCYVGKKLEGI